MELKDYLHYYLQSNIGVYIFPDETITDGFLDKYRKDYPNGEYAPKLTFNTYHRFLRDGYKPILRKLEDITDEELKEMIVLFSRFDLSKCEFEFDKDDKYWVNAIKDGSVIDCLCIEMNGQIDMMYATPATNPQSEAFHWLLKKGFDLFDLIDAGLAIDSKTLIENK